jgi:hypothetical protein
MKTKTEKRYKVIKERDGKSPIVMEGTLSELIQSYSYSLEVGESWQHEKGNKKINRNPKSISALINNLGNADNNAAANGYAGTRYSYQEVNI